LYAEHCRVHHLHESIGECILGAIMDGSLLRGLFVGYCVGRIIGRSAAAFGFRGCRVGFIGGVQGIGGGGLDLRKLFWVICIFGSLVLWLAWKFGEFVVVLASGNVVRDSAG